MDRRNMGGVKEKRLAVFVSPELHRKMKAVASFRGMSLKDYVDGILSGIVDDDFMKMEGRS